MIKQYHRDHTGGKKKGEKIPHEKRLFAIRDRLKKEPKKWTTGMLAPIHHVGQRQIQADIQELIALGFPIQSVGRRLFIDEDEK